MKNLLCHKSAPVARVANPDDNVINPWSPAEIAEEVAECARAGASQVHLHVRTENGEITRLTETYSHTLDLIRAKSDILIQGSTGGYGIPYMSLELPVNHMRDHTLSICKNTDFEFAPDRLIRDTVNDSVQYVAKLIG